MARRLMCLAGVAGFIALGAPGRAFADDDDDLSVTKKMWFAEKKDHLVVSTTFSELFDAKAYKALSSGFATTVVLRAYVYPKDSDLPVALSLAVFRVVYDLWDEVYRIKIAATGGEKDTAAINVDGVLRQCFEVRDFGVVERALLRMATPHYLGVIIEINPISPQMLEQMRKWISRPTGSTGIAPSDALFGSFVGLFVRSIGTSDKTLRFRTQPLTP